MRSSLPGASAPAASSAAWTFGATLAYVPVHILPSPPSGALPRGHTRNPNGVAARSKVRARVLGARPHPVQEDDGGRGRRWCRRADRRRPTRRGRAAAPNAPSSRAQAVSEERGSRASRDVEGERLLGIVVPATGPRRTRRCARRGARRSGPSRAASAPCRSASDDLDDVVPARRLEAVEVDVLDVLPVAPLVGRAVAIEVEAARGRPRALAAATRSSAGVTSARFTSAAAGAPRDGELQEPRLHAAALVDDPVAVVVDGVEAELRPRRRARLHERRARRRPRGSSPATLGCGAGAAAPGRRPREERRAPASAERAAPRRACSLRCGMTFEPPNPAGGAPAFASAPSATRARDSADGLRVHDLEERLPRHLAEGRRLAAQRHEHALLLGELQDVRWPRRA